MRKEVTFSLLELEINMHKLCLAQLRNKNLGKPLIFNNKYISED